MAHVAPTGRGAAIFFGSWAPGDAFSDRAEEYVTRPSGACHEDRQMRLLVAPHDLGIGGSQINAIDLAAGAAEAGHDVTVYGVPGPLLGLVEAHGLDFVPARPLRYRPAPS